MDLDNLDTFRIATCDLNGQMRGKRMPQKDQRKIGLGRSAYAIICAERRYLGGRYYQ